MLSGGERARVALAKLLIKPGNLLLMDEPTNHLDLESSESLAESLTAYDGSLLFVSHNRAFVRKLATKIWNVHDGTVEIYPGTLDEYLASARERGESLEAVADGKATQGKRKPTQHADVGVAKTETEPAAKQAPTPAKRDRATERERKRQEAASASAGASGSSRSSARSPSSRVASTSSKTAKSSARSSSPIRRSTRMMPTQPSCSRPTSKRPTSSRRLNERWEMASMELEEVLEELG